MKNVVSPTFEAGQFENFMAEYKSCKKLVNYIINKWEFARHDENIRQELHQDILIALWRLQPKYDQVRYGKFSSWAGAVAQKIILGYWDKYKKKRRCESIDFIEDFAEADDSNPYESLLQGLERFKESLTEKHRTILECFFETEDYNLVCERLKIEYNVVRKAMFFIREKMRTEAKKYFGDVDLAPKINVGKRKSGADQAQSKRIVAINWKNEEREFDSISEAAKELGGCRSTIIDVLKGRGNTAFGFKWKYSDN